MHAQDAIKLRAPHGVSSVFRPFSGDNLEHQRAQLSPGVHLAGTERGAPRAGALHVQRLQSHRDPRQDQRRSLASDGNQVRRIATRDKSRDSLLGRDPGKGNGLSHIVGNQFPFRVRLGTVCLFILILPYSTL